MFLNKVKSRFLGGASVNYLDGVWLNFSVGSTKDANFDVFVNGDCVANSVSCTDGVVDCCLPVAKLASLIEGRTEVCIEVQRSGSGAVILTYTDSVDRIYKKQFEYIHGDVNSTLVNLPFLNEYSVGLLGDSAKLSIVRNLFLCNLGEDADNLVELLLSSLASISLSKDEDLYWHLLGNSAFLSKLATESFLARCSSFESFLTDALMAMPQLEAQSFIQFSGLPATWQKRFYDACVKARAIECEDAEDYPLFSDKGVSEWECLDASEQKRLWPLLFARIEHTRQFDFAKNYPPGFIVDGLDEELAHESLIEAASSQWYSISLAVYAASSGLPTSTILRLLQQFVATRGWDDFAYLDQFSYVVNYLVSSEIAGSDYDVLVDIIFEFIRIRAQKLESDLYRTGFIKAVVAVINWGIVSANFSWYRLNQQVLPYWVFDEGYAEALCVDEVRRFDGETFDYLNRVFSRAASSTAFFGSLNERSFLDVGDIRVQLHNLLWLKEHGVRKAKGWILTLSRYCQLHQVDELYDELVQFHKSIEDFYTAYQLSTTDEQRDYFERKLSWRSLSEKRGDSYWFERALLVRKEAITARVDFADDLFEYIKSVNIAGRPACKDLVELLTGEFIYLTIQDAEFEIAADVFNFLDKAYPEGLLVLKLVLSFNGSDATEVRIKSLARSFDPDGNALDSVLSGLKVISLGSGSSLNVEDLLVRLKQRYVFPYMQVLIYSCNAYESSRHEVIRNSWLKDLTAYGIDYKIVVGGADHSVIENDKMRLSVPDTYEFLPQKSVEMFRFSASSTSYRYHYKLDDDCVLNALAMFSDPSFLGQDYYGRVVTRGIGGIDRSWHQAKSTTSLAKNALDLSPEGSTYCDGSTGYVLSDIAATKLTEVVQDPYNSPLIESSYFEDKLIGDLMAVANVPAVQYSYSSVVRRRVAGGNDVQIWEYNLLPSSKNNIKVLHTEDDDFRLNYGRKIGELDFFPSLIFGDAASEARPTNQWVENADALLEKIHVDEEAIRRAKHVAIIVAKNEGNLLPNLLQHHRSIGIEHFLFVDNCSDDDTLSFLSSQTDVSTFVATQEYKYSRFGVNWQETLLKHYCVGKWALIIDTDELFTYSGMEERSIASLTKTADEEGASAFFAPMIDFYPQSSLENSDITGEKPFYDVCSFYDDLETMSIDSDPSYGPFSNSVCWHGGLRMRIFGRYANYPAPNYLNQKYNLIKYHPKMRLVEGLHFMYGATVATEKAVLMHFKYHSGFHDKVMREVKSGQHWGGGKEYKRYAKRLENQESAALYQSGVSKSYSSSSEFIKDVFKND